MAEENITIQHKKVNTASFDMVRRILTVPIWKEMSNDMYDLFMGHEVGHALDTPCDPEVLEEAISRSCMPFINVTEDARIERSVKRRFPGLKGPFFRAYKELMDEDFFGIGDKNLADMAFIDRLNIYFKTAMNDFDAAQLFSDEEMPFVDRMATTETFTEVADLSEDIYNFVSEKKTDDQQSEDGDDQLIDQSQGMSQEFNDESGDSDDQENSDQDQGQDQQGDTDGDGDEQSDDAKSQSQQSEENSGDEDADGADEGDEGETGEDSNTITDARSGGKSGENVDEFESVTDDSAAENMIFKNDTDANDIDYLTLPDFDVSDYIVPHKKVHASIDDMKSHWLSEYPNADLSFATPYKKVLRENNKTINYLVKEFEMKKAAEAYSNQIVAKSGNINASKLWSYKLNDDIFQRKSILPDGKNHGMVMMVDWSGSMYNQLYKTVVQVITLATFARRVNIPFEVYNFTDMTPKDARDDVSRRNDAQLCDDNLDKIVVDHETTLRQVLTNKMTTSEFNRACDNYIWLAWSITRHSLYGCAAKLENRLGGTPMVESLLLLDKVIGKFQKENNVEKLSFMVLSDGDAADGVGYVAGGQSYGGKSWYARRRVSEYGNVTTVIHDERTGKNIVWNGRSGWRRENDGKEKSQEMMLRLIKEVHNAKSIGFFVCDNTRDLTYAIQQYCIIGYDYGRKQRNQKKKDVRKNGFVTALGCGYDEYYIIDQRTQGVETELEVDETMTKAKIARNFSKFQSTKKQSRQMLNKFVDLVK